MTGIKVLPDPHVRVLKSQIKSGQLTNSFKTRLQDKAGKFRKTQRLYGRETEIAQLLASYANLAHSRSMLALVAGYSGVGKSAVVTANSTAEL